MTRIAVYPGSFDPITNGHVDIIDRGCRLFDTIIVAVSVNPQKKSLFTVAERKALIENIFAGRPEIRVDSFAGLLVDYVHQVGAMTIVRGLRAISDFEYEFQMGLMNRRISGGAVETVFMMPREKYTYLSSALIKEVALLGGSVGDMVPKLIHEALLAKRDSA